ncbi:hypothetical protein F9C11_04555 [Amycolatopsis sp. VS8301801F10]|uniref:hypothetical protein n=1 Tax=Amycolatopsis sp. VS8301801F10 TaxID=2652442 RepID=UPI0038FCBB7F
MATPCGLAPSATSASSPLGTAGSALLGMADRARPGSSFTRAGARRRPRAWAAPLARPAARIAVAGGLTLAGWLLGAALSQANATTDDPADRPIVSAHEAPEAHETEPEQHYAGTATSGTLTWAMPGTATGAKHNRLHRFEASAHASRPDVSFRPTTVAASEPESPSAAAPRPATKPAKPASPATPKHHAPASAPAPEATTQPGLLSSISSAISPSSSSSSSSEQYSREPQQGLLDGLLGGSGPGLLNGLLGSPEPVQPGLLDGILGTVDTTLHTTATSVDTVLDTAPVRVVEPPVAPVAPAPPASGSVIASVPAAKLAKEPEAPVAVKVSKPAPVAHAVATRVLFAQEPAAKQETQPAAPVKQRSQAGGGSSGGEGLPAAPAAPAAPASTVSPGHDGHGGLRQLSALSGDGDTVTQLKLIGVSRDHEVDGAGREAALPTTSPD